MEVRYKTFKKDGFHDVREVMEFLEDHFTDGLDETYEEETSLDISSTIDLDGIKGKVANEIREYYTGIMKENHITKTVDDFISDEDVIIRYYDGLRVNDDLTVDYHFGWVGTYAKKYQNCNEEFDVCESSASDYVMEMFKELGFVEV